MELRNIRVRQLARRVISILPIVAFSGIVCFPLIATPHTLVSGEQKLLHARNSFRYLSENLGFPDSQYIGGQLGTLLTNETNRSLLEIEELLDRPRLIADLLGSLPSTHKRIELPKATFCQFYTLYFVDCGPDWGLIERVLYFLW